jgi:hypothetical protein
MKPCKKKKRRTASQRQWKAVVPVPQLESLRQVTVVVGCFLAVLLYSSPVSAKLLLSSSSVTTCSRYIRLWIRSTRACSVSLNSECPCSFPIVVSSTCSEHEDAVASTETRPSSAGHYGTCVVVTRSVHNTRLTSRVYFDTLRLPFLLLQRSLRRQQRQCRRTVSWEKQKQRRRTAMPRSLTSNSDDRQAAPGPGTTRVFHTSAPTPFSHNRKNANLIRESSWQAPLRRSRSRTTPCTSRRTRRTSRRATRHGNSDISSSARTSGCVCLTQQTVVSRTGNSRNHVEICRWSKWTELVGHTGFTDTHSGQMDKKFQSFQMANFVPPFR